MGKERKLQHNGSLYDRPRSIDIVPASPGRRLSSAELEAVAAKMGLDVAANRFSRESEWSRTQRARAYEQGVEQESKLKHDGVPKRYRLRANVPPRKKRP